MDIKNLKCCLKHDIAHIKTRWRILKKNYIVHKQFVKQHTVIKKYSTI